MREPESQTMNDCVAKLNRPFRIIAFDWDGTAVESRAADASAVTERLEKLMKLDVQIVVITGTNFDNINRQFSRFVRGPHKRSLYVLTNRGSEVYGFDDQSEPVLLFRREASERENEMLTRVAEGVRDYVRERGGPPTDIVYNRLNRRKIDLIPEPEWADPPKSQIGELLAATERRLARGGITGGIKELFTLSEELSRKYELESAKITSDVKHIEVGLTDKADSVAWIVNVLAPRIGAGAREILILGDEFGPIAGFEGSDFKMVIEALGEAVFVSVGREPNGVPNGVIHLGGGPARFLDLLNLQIALIDLTRACEGQS
jgi:hydroxymethylpyrimidine pyrophosphatase-like HAD family hydrolase